LGVFVVETSVTVDDIGMLGLADELTACLVVQGLLASGGGSLAVTASLLSLLDTAVVFSFSIRVEAGVTVVARGGVDSVRSIADSITVVMTDDGIKAKGGEDFAPSSDVTVSALLVSIAGRGIGIVSSTDFDECRFAFFSFDIRLSDGGSGSIVEVGED
jgi:hypothetical protein